jgi:ubiquinone/menaquinone biosynthesis C-methylase UbiE
MIAHGQQLALKGAKPTLALHNVGTEPLPNATGSVHLVTMTSVLHIIDDPLAVLAEIRRVLAPGGIFMLHDWIRMPLQTYLERRQQSMMEGEAGSRRSGFRLFPQHCKYTIEDWQWVLGQAGLRIRHQTQLRPTHQMFVTTPA